VKLAALLLHEPNLLLLDEPTNFLDLRTQILLEHFLRDHDGGCLIVSHDRTFLNATCDHTLALSRGKLIAFPGKIEAYLEFERERREHGERSNEAILAKRRHLEDFIARNKARAATAKLAQSKSKMLEKLELEEVLGDEPTVRIRPPRIEPRKGIALRCTDLAIGYPERQIASDIQLELDHGSRAAIVGDNGQGKTTLAAKSAGASVARSVSTLSTFTPACPRSRALSSTSGRRPHSARRSRKSSRWRDRFYSGADTSKRRSRS
jgi:ATP-binding cassette subfamily F protein 3